MCGLRDIMLCICFVRCNDMYVVCECYVWFTRCNDV